VSEDERISIIKEEFRDSKTLTSINSDITNTPDNSASSGNDGETNSTGKK
jgi:hypothetical protein